MQVVIDNIKNIIDGLIASGIGRNNGQGQPDFDMESIEKIKWATSKSQAEKFQKSDEFSDFLLYLRPEAEFEDVDLRKKFDSAMNEIAQMVKPICEDKLSGLIVPGITNEPIGFSAPYVIQTIEFLLISLAQEILAEAEFGLVGPLPCKDLLEVYKAGHIVCGYDSENYAIVLY